MEHTHDLNQKLLDDHSSDDITREAVAWQVKLTHKKTKRYVAGSVVDQSLPLSSKEFVSATRLRKYDLRSEMTDPFGWKGCKGREKH